MFPPNRRHMTNPPPTGLKYEHANAKSMRVPGSAGSPARFARLTLAGTPLNARFVRQMGAIAGVFGVIASDSTGGGAGGLQGGWG